MFRRFILTAALAASAGAYVLAQAVPATFILTDGSRKTGTMGFYGDKQENLIGGYLGLDTPNGRERFKVEQVAVIDFAGGYHASRRIVIGVLAMFLTGIAHAILIWPFFGFLDADDLHNDRWRNLRDDRTAHARLQSVLDVVRQSHQGSG